MDIKNKRKISLERADELKLRISDYTEARNNIPAGLKMSDKISERKEKIKKVLNASEEQWNNWEWQMANRISNTEILGKIINIDKSEIDSVASVYAWAVSPYYVCIADG